MKINLVDQPFNVKLLCTLLSLLATGYLVVLGKHVLAPLILASLLSMLLLPLAKFFEKKCRFRRNPASITTVLVMIAFIGGVFYFLGAQISRLVGDWPTFKEQLNGSTADVENWVSIKFNIDTAKQIKYVHNATTKIMNSGTSVAGATLVSLSSVMFFMLFSFIYTFFFLLYRGLIMKFLERVFSADNGRLVYDIIEQVQYIVRKYLLGLLSEMIIIAAFISIMLSVMGIKYAILLGVITGLFNIIPYIGIFSALIISSLITFATAATTTKVLWVIALFLGTHAVDANLLLPLIVGSKVKINAMITILGIVLGEMIWGIPGMFLSIPVIAVLKIIFDRVESFKPWGFLLGDEDEHSRRVKQKITGDQSPPGRKI
jgi:predicted PurR-regulated permease PerM